MCAKSFDIYSRHPYTGQFVILEPVEAVDPATAPPFDCAPPATLSPGVPAVLAHRPVSGMPTTGCDTAAGCC
ncbi:MAG: hypothetical protein ACRDSH_09035 [Pseudonocardiaceae bacterium]